MSSGSLYSQLTPALISELTAIVGEKNILTGEGREDYSHDEAPHPHPHLPEAVVKPGAPAEIAAILKLASRNNIPVTPRGTGTGLSGGAVPVFGGISLSLERLNKILEIDEANFSVTAE